MNLRLHSAVPKNRQTSFILIGTGMFLMASTWIGS